MKISKSLYIIPGIMGLIYASFIFGNCSGSKKLVENQNESSDSCLGLIISDNRADNITGRTYDIVSFDLVGHCLQTVVMYSGGCSIPQKKVNLIKIANKLYPKQALLDLVISDDDACRERITDSISIDLSYLNAMARDGGILIKFEGQQKEFFYALPLR